MPAEARSNNRLSIYLKKLTGVKMAGFLLYLILKNNK